MRWISVALLLVALATINTGCMAMTNGVIYPVVAVDWDADGSFATAGDDISDYVISVKWRRGIFGRFDQMARVGTATVLLSNTDKRFSPEYASGDYYGNLLPGREIQIQFSDGGTTWDTFRGVIVSINPTPGTHGPWQMALECECTLGRINRTKTFSIPLAQELTVDDALERIGASIYKTGRATGTLTVDSVPANGELVAIGSNIYTMVTAAPASPYEVLIGASAAATAQNITDAINTAYTASTTYGANTEKHPEVSAAVSGAEITLTALARGTWGNRIPLSAGIPEAVVDSITIDYGTVGAGTVADTYTQNATYYQLDEAATTPGLQVQFDFVVNGSAGEFNLYGYYSAAPGQNIYVFFYNYVSGTWSMLPDDPITHAGAPGNYAVTLPPQYVSSDGDISCITQASGAGNPAYDWFLDHIYVTTDMPETAGSFTVSGATFSGGTDGPVGLMNYDTGILELSQIGDLWDDDTSGYQAMREVIESEPASLLWTAGDGTLTFKNKDWVFKQYDTAASLTLDGESNNALGSIDWDEVINRVDIEYTPKTTTSSGVIARAKGVVAIPGLWGVNDAERYNPSYDLPESGTGFVKLPFVDSGTGEPAGVASVVLPLVAGTDFEVYDDAAGEGYDYTNDGLLTLNAAVTGSGIELQVQNTALGVLYLHNLQVRGTLYVAYDSSHALVEDTTSQGTYGLQAQSYVLPIPSSDVHNLAPAYGQWLIGANKDPVFRIDALEFLGQTEIGSVNLYSLDIGDNVDYSEEQTAVSDHKLLITATEGEWYIGRPSRIKFAVRRIDDFKYWILEDADSELGVNTRLGI